MRLACDWAFVVFGQSLVFDEFVEDRGGETARTPDGGNGDLFLSSVWGRHIVEIGLVRLPVPATALYVSGAWRAWRVESKRFSRGKIYLAP